MKPLCILFAGPAGCSKSPLASYLSWQLELPIFSHDEIRTEVREDMLKPELDVEVYLERRDSRLNQILKAGSSFIYDASIDRSWPYKRKLLSQHGYDWFIVSFNLSPGALAEQARSKGYSSPQWQVDKWQEEHNDFWQQHQAEVNLVIDDKNFRDRLKLTLTAVKQKLSH